MELIRLKFVLPFRQEILWERPMAQDGVEARNVNIRAISDEDEQLVNSEELKRLFFQKMQGILMSQAYARWSTNPRAGAFDPNLDEYRVVNEDDGRSFGMQFTQDGLAMDLDPTDPVKLELMFKCMDAYNQAHDKFHPKSKMEFELTCNTKAEAEAILKAAQKSGIHITSLKYFPGPNQPESDPGQDLSDILKSLAEENKNKPGQARGGN